jgi:signal transduction histidine kinase
MFRSIFILLLTALGLLVHNHSKAFDIKGSSSEFITDFKIFLDSTNQMSLQEVIKHNQFKSNINSSVPSLGVTKHAYWLCLNVSNLSPFTSLVFEVSYPILDLLEFYHLQNDSVQFKIVTGERLPFSSRKNTSETFVFPLNLKPGANATYYFKVESGEQIIFPAKILTIEELYERKQNIAIFNGIYFGIVLVMFLYNIFLFLALRDSSYGYYVLYIFFVGLTQAILNGYAFKYFWPNNTWLAQHAILLGGSLSGLTTIFFVRDFLQTKIFSPRFNLLLTGFAGIYVITMFLCFFGELQLSYQLINANAGLGSFILLFSAININLKYETRSSRFFIIAWSIFLISVIIFVAKDLGLFPYNSFTVSGLQIGSAIVVTFLSFALADKINTYRKEKELSQAEALSIALENERIIAEQNILLEDKVLTRTTELKKTNDELNNTLKNLKDTQSQLVEQEKMASLGQLTAGIAHEINNPINFVTSSIKPLKRDIDLLIELSAKIENLGVDGIDSEKRKLVIAKLKNEYDYKFLLEEISYLLKGISDGSSRTAEIVKGLRVFSRVDEDDIKQSDVNEGLDSTIVICNNIIGSKIAIEKSYSSNGVIECFPGKLNQVFMNMISNAAYAVKEKFQDKSGGLIKISTQRTQTELSIVFEDNGLGMDEQTQKKLFEPFFTTKPVGEGTGLGLSIVFTTIRKHDGQILVESTPGMGTKFIIILPVTHK